MCQKNSVSLTLQATSQRQLIYTHQTIIRAMSAMNWHTSAYHGLHLCAEGKQR
uniref:Uncharacterized protein n=1 Tax=uncultured Vibrionales bacterium HF0010_22E23 TaxID=710999 RepID=E0XRG7_9GAMM|nr:hypothetical protein [uncultured Vibrionales bacterium HF0010_22E23]